MDDEQGYPYYRNPTFVCFFFFVAQRTGFSLKNSFQVVAKKQESDSEDTAKLPFDLLRRVPGRSLRIMIINIYIYNII